MVITNHGIIGAKKVNNFLKKSLGGFFYWNPNE